MAEIRIEGMDELLKQLDALGRPETFDAALDAAALYLKGKADDYPPAANAHRPQPFKSDKQRRGFFAKLHAGEIEVPYRRGQSPGSEAHGRRWTISRPRAGMRVIGNNSSYGPLLQSLAAQARYHKASGWQTVEEIVTREREKVVDLVRDALAKALDKLMR